MSIQVTFDVFVFVKEPRFTKSEKSNDNDKSPKGPGGKSKEPEEDDDEKPDDESKLPALPDDQESPDDGNFKYESNDDSTIANIAVRVVHKKNSKRVYRLRIHSSRISIEHQVRRFIRIQNMVLY